MAATPGISPTPPDNRRLEEPPPRRLCLNWQALLLPCGAAVGVAAFGLLGVVRQSPTLLWSMIAAAASLMAWAGLLLARTVRTQRPLAIDVSLRKQHYLQACAQASVLLYWGWHWPQVYASAHLIAAQLLFAYAFDMLLSWSLRGTYTLGFGPFPVVFSINLFLWFRPDWFYLQFLMVALGFAAKDLIRWERDGRRAHIFNPSSFPLAVVSLALLATGMSDATWGNEIAVTQFFPPHMYLWLFLIGLPGQFFFGVTSMTMSAVVTTYVFGLAYVAATGTYFFYDSYIPIAVFLGMHLLFTDPSTSPRTELGRIMFGVLYGLSAVALYQILGAVGLPTFYDKLLQVPILNLSVKGIDRAARSKWLRAIDPAAIGRALSPRQRSVAYMAIWAGVFTAMSGAQGVGDRHPGQWVPVWQQACRSGQPRACAYLFNLQSIFCNAGSGWACNELAVGYPTEGGARRERWLDSADALASFERGCRLGFRPACRNLELLRAGAASPESAPPTLQDYPIILRGSKGEITDRSAISLYAAACRQGWPDTCGLPGRTDGE